MSDFVLEIDKYLSGDMSEIEKQAFEAKISSDPMLAEELKLQKDMRSIYDEQNWFEGDKKILKQEETKQLQTFFKSEESEVLKNTIQEVISENKSNSGNRFLPILKIAAVIAVLITISIYLFKEPSYEDLYAEYMHMEEIPSLISRGESGTKELENAQVLFRDEKYTKAIEIFTQYQANAESINPLSFIYTGVAFLEINEFEKALTQFELLANSNTLQSKKAIWYKAMVFLKQNNEEKLIENLEVIVADKNNYNFDKAQQLLEIIE